MATEPGDLEERIRRLEALTAFLVMHDTDLGDTREGDELLYRLFQQARGGPDDIYYLLSDFVRHRRHDIRPRTSLKRQIEGLRELHTEAWSLAKRQQDVIQESVTSNQQETHMFLALLSMGLDLADVKIARIVPIRAYLAQDDKLNTVNVARLIERLLEVFGFEVADNFVAETGSWWKKWFAKSKDVITKPQMQDRLKKLERAIEIQGLHKPQSEVDKNQAEAVKAVLEGVRDQPHASIQIGSILVLKTTNVNGECVVQVRQLSQKQLIALENAPELLQSPSNALKLLAEACRGASSSLDD